MACADFMYGAEDVAEVLTRLTTICSSRSIDAENGAYGYIPPIELQGHWAAVAEVAGPVGDGVLGPATENLREVYKHIEAVIVACGAPDMFDVCELCFEALTKIGFYVRDPDGRELLLGILGDVHEVYDILLSCVETYEWVQPGTTGNLRLWMMQVLFACFGSSRLTGRILMELTGNDVSGAISLIAFLIRCDQAPFEMQSTAGRCLVELTTADSVFLTSDSPGEVEDTQNQQIAKLTGMLNRHVNGLIKGLIQFDVVEAFGRCICLHQMSFERTDIVVKYFLTTVHNSLLYCSDNQKKLRQHLATQSTIVEDIMLPYIYNILPALYDAPHCGPSMIEWQNLKSVLQTFVVVTFNITVFRPHIAESELLVKVCDVPRLLTYISMLELLVKLAINVDITKGPWYAQVVERLLAAFNDLPPDSAARLQRRLTSEQSNRLPYSRSCTEACTALAVFLTPPADEEELVEQRVDRVVLPLAPTKMPFGVQQAGEAERDAAASHAALEAAAAAGLAASLDADDGDEDMPPLIPAGGWETYLGASDQAGVPSAAICQLNGTLMHDPVVTPEGYRFERAVLEDWANQCEPGAMTNPLTGQPLEMESVQSDLAVKEYIQGYQMEMMSAAHISSAAEVAGADASPATKKTPLLGDLPALQAVAAHTSEKEKKKKEKNKIRIESRSVVDCPEEMRCAIDGKVCINPVRSPYGHLFEKKTLDRWFLNCGSVCPVTQRPLRAEDCAPDGDMKKRIVKFLKGAQH